MRLPLLLAFLAAVALPAQAQFQFPPVPIGGTLQADFTVTTTSGSPVSGIVVSLSVPEGCGTVSPTQVTTDSRGVGRFQFTPGSRTGVCQIAGSSAGTTLFGRTTVFRPSDIAVGGEVLIRTSTGADGQFDLTITAGGLPLGPLAVEAGPFQPAGPTLLAGAPAATDAAGKLRYRFRGTPTAGVYDLPLRIAGVERRARLELTTFVPSTDTPYDFRVQGEPWMNARVTLLDGAGGGCAAGSAVPSTVGRLSAPAGMVDYFEGPIEINLSCTRPTVRARVDFGETIPSDGQAWLYAFNAGSGWSWKPLQAQIQGSTATFTIPEFVQSTVGSPQLVKATVAVWLPGAGPRQPAPPQVQDLWWNPLENGWGLSVAQNTAGWVFAAIYAYDAAGEPTWWVMPSGDWMTGRAPATFSTAAYTPIGTPWHAYQAQLLVVGDKVGRAKLRFADANHLTLDYAFNGGAGTKTLQRQPFGGTSRGSRPDVGGMWWAGQAQNGWGIAVTQQGEKLFNVWYTYDASNKPRWYVMPDGQWTAADTYEGRIYRTRGSPWLGTAYDPSRLVVTDVGSFRLRFNASQGSVVSGTFDYTLEGRQGTHAIFKQF